MMKNQSTKTYIFFSHWVLIALFVFFFKLNDIAPTLNQSYSDNIFRIGVIPWSDAKAWIDGAFQIANGQKLTGVPTCRPLYPLFLSCFAHLCSSNYLYFIFVQLLLSAVCIGFAFMIIKSNLNHSYFAGLIFIACLILWRTNFVTVFLTENLGMALLIICMTLIWVSLETGFFSFLLAGYFILGLSQATRPWCVMTLVTVPFLPVLMSSEHANFIARQSKLSHLNRKRFTFLLFVSIMAGYMFQPAATWLFTEPGQRYANNSKTLYGQIVGGNGWLAIYDYPIILEAIQSNLAPEEIDKVIFQQCLKHFTDDPMKFFSACWKGYVKYFIHLPDVFNNNLLSLFHWLIIFFFFIVFTGIRTSIEFFQNNGHALILVLLCLILFYFFPFYFLSCGLFIGCVLFIRDYRSLLSKFLMLYFIGILLSIPVVGYDGGERVKIGNDIFIFIITAKGISHMGLFFCKNIIHNDSIIIWPKNTKIVWCFPLLTSIILLIIPLFIYNCHYNHEKKINDIDLAKDIQIKMNTDSIPFGPTALEKLWHLYPNPSFERIHNQPAFLLIRYVERDVVFFKKNVGFVSCYYPSIHWPLSVLSIDRCIYVHEKRYCLFPKVHLSQLEAYKNKMIIVFGTLHARKRTYINSTGFVLTVSHIGLIDTDQNIHWKSLEDMNDS